MKNMRCMFNYLLNSRIGDMNENYIDEFQKAYLTFKYQRVWCPVSNRLVSLNPLTIGSLKLDIFTEKDLDGAYPDNFEFERDVSAFKDLALLVKVLRKEGSLAFLGPVLPQDLAQNIAHCKYDPITKLQFKMPASLEMIVTDQKYHQVKTMAMGKLSKGTDSQVSELSLKSFFGRSQSSVPNVFFPVKTENIEVREIKFAQSIKKEDNKENQGKEMDEEPSSPKNKSGFQREEESGSEIDEIDEVALNNKKLQSGMFLNAMGSSKAKQSLKTVFENYKIEARRTVTKTSIMNFRKEYLSRIKKN